MINKGYANYPKTNFRQIFITKLIILKDIFFLMFDSFSSLLNKNAPSRTGDIRANQKEFIDMELNEAITVRSKPCHK